MRLYAGRWDKKGFLDGASMTALFWQPRGLLLLPDDRVLVCEVDNHCIRVISADGSQVSTYAGSPGENGFRDGPVLGSALFNCPKCLLLLPDGSILVTDTWNHCIRKISNTNDGSFVPRCCLS